MENLENLRASLVQKIFSTNNLNLLEAINKIFTSTEEEKKYMLSENQKKLLLVAEEQIKYGEVVSDEELRKLDEEWMSKKLYGLKQPSYKETRFLLIGIKEIKIPIFLKK